MIFRPYQENKNSGITMSSNTASALGIYNLFVKKEVFSKSVL